METFWRSEVRARKQHVCDYCGNVIEKGEVYSRSTHKGDAGFYEWKCHLKCRDISSEIWDIVDPDEGMTHEDFCEKLREVAGTFICPECPHYDKDADDCDCSLETKCINHIHEFFQKYELVQKEPYVWKISEKKIGAQNAIS